MFSKLEFSHPLFFVILTIPHFYPSFCFPFFTRGSWCIVHLLFLNRHPLHTSFSVSLFIYSYHLSLLNQHTYSALYSLCDLYVLFATAVRTIVHVHTHPLFCITMRASHLKEHQYRGHPLSLTQPTHSLTFSLGA